MASENDEIRRAQHGDRQAFEALVRRYQRRVYITARRILGSHTDADDVAQEAFLRAYRGLASFDGRSDVFTWLYRIVVNVALNHLRSARRHQASALDEASNEAGHTSDPAGRAEAREACLQVREAIAHLPPSLRVTVVLALLEELPHKKVGEILGCSEGTVAWRVNQARKMLRRALAPRTPREEARQESATEAGRGGKEPSRGGGSLARLRAAVQAMWERGSGLGAFGTVRVGGRVEGVV